jgi:hypothetical protein
MRWAAPEEGQFPPLERNVIAKDVKVAVAAP